MGVSISNIAVKSADTKEVGEIITKYDSRSYLTPSENNWVVVLPENDLDIETVFDSAKNLSFDLKTVSMVGIIHGSADFWFKIYDGGSCIFSFSDLRSSKEFHKIDTGNLQTLKKYVSDNVSFEEIENILGDINEYAFAEDKYADICRILGLPEYLSSWSYEYVLYEKDRGDFERLAKMDNLPELTLYPTD